MKLSNYDVNSTIFKDKNMPINNWLHAKFVLWGYDHFTDDEYLLGETMDKRVAKKWINWIHKDPDYQIIVEYPGSYYTTAHELRWCDNVANRTHETPFCVSVENDIPF